MKYHVGFIGVGNMGGALLEAVCKSVSANEVAIYDVSSEKSLQQTEKTGAVSVSLNDVVDSKYLFIGVKPNIINKVLDEIRDSLSEDTVLVSMAAGVSVEKIAQASDTNRIIRIMPNTPAAVGEGMILYCNGIDVTESDLIGFTDILKKAGTLDKIDEKLIDAAAALSGCGPAYVFMFIDALADGAVKCGLPRDKALMYAKQTVMGSSYMSKCSEKHPEQLKDEVCSPGGTTIEGVLALEKGAFRSIVSKAVISAFEKTSKL